MTAPDFTPDMTDTVAANARRALRALDAHEDGLLDRQDAIDYVFRVVPGAGPSVARAQLDAMDLETIDSAANYMGGSA